MQNAADQGQPPEVVDLSLGEGLHHPHDPDEQEHEAEDVGESGERFRAGGSARRLPEAVSSTPKITHSHRVLAVDVGEERTPRWRTPGT